MEENFKPRPWSGSWAQTVTNPVSEVVKLGILQKREYLLNSIEFYITMVAKRTPESHMLPELRGRYMCLYYEIAAALIASYESEDKVMKIFIVGYEKFTFDDIMNRFNLINNWLYGKRLIMFDTKKQYDGTNTEEENEHHGL